MRLEDFIEVIPDFPKKGIQFKDVTSLMQNGEVYKECVKQMAKLVQEMGAEVVVGPESRGFIFGVPVAYNLGKAFVPVRKKGKLPCETIEASYELEYGQATIEMHKDSIKPGQKVVIIDDLMATGGTLEAIIKLVEQLGGEVVKICCLMELAGLNGRAKLEQYDVASVICYEGK